MINPRNPRHIRKLQEAINWSRGRLRHRRKKVRKFVSQYGGHLYSEETQEKPTYINLMELAAQVFERKLAARPPDVAVNVRNRQLRPTGTKLREMLNGEIKSEHYQIHRAIRRWVKASLFGQGILKVGSVSRGSYEHQGFMFERTEPYMKSVLFDDWVHDMRARDEEEVEYEGNRYECDLEKILDGDIFPEKSKERLRRIDERKQHNEGGDERIQTLTQGDSIEAGQVGKKVELWEIFLPNEQLLVTLPMELDTPEALLIVEWEGPKRGPYHKLWYNDVPGQSLPLPPAMLWSGLHGVANSLYRKLDRQAIRQKTIGVVRGEDSEDGDLIRRTPDGSVVAVENPESLNEMSMGGVNQGNFAFFLQTRDLFSWINGNIDVIGGLSGAGETATENQIIDRNASDRVRFMQDEVYQRTKNAIKDFGWYLWTDPLAKYDVEIPIPGAEPIHAELTPEEREHDYYAFNIDIIPGSMQYRSPQERVTKIDRLMQTIILPLLPMLQQQGIQLNARELLEIYSEYENLDELQRILGFSLDSAPMSTSGSGEARQSPVTSRTQHRVSSPGPSSRQASDANLISRFMGGGQGTQNSEMAGAVRSGSS